MLLRYLFMEYILCSTWLLLLELPCLITRDGLFLHQMNFERLTAQYDITTGGSSMFFHIGQK